MPNRRMRSFWLPLAALILLALAIRLPRAGEIATHYDWLTSHTALVTRIWQMTGLAANHYSLVTNWPNPADLGIQHGAASVTDARGHTFFLSFPPLAFYVSYALFTITGQGASLLPLRLLMLMFSVLGAVALARAVRQAWGDGEEAVVPALIAAGVFLLCPSSLIYFTTAFFPLILSIPLWMLLLAEAMRRPAPRPWAIALASFFLCYTDWLGFLAALPLTWYWLRRRDFGLIAALLAPAGLALGITLLTYSSIAGWDALLASMREKYLLRAGLTDEPQGFSIANPTTYYLIGRNLLLGFAPLALAFGWAGLGWVLGRAEGQSRPAAPLPAGAWMLLACLAVPAALDNILLLNHTAGNRYTVLKWAPALGLALAMLTAARPWRNVRLDLACAALTALLCAFFFWRITFDQERGVPEIAAIVQYQVGLDRVLFLQRNRNMGMADPSLLLLSERNFHMVNSPAEAREKLRRLPGVKGSYITVKSYQPVRIVHTPLEP
ncbi:MAG: hypothetical protein IT162_05090 [Bryobacterales bacterium]|nr:hypothetical protein [Bryobacterales bacterium]